MQKITEKRKPNIILKLSLRFAREYFDMLEKMYKKYTLEKIQESESLTITQRALWTSLIIEVGRLFDTYESVDKKVISFKKVNSLKREIDKIHGEVIIGKIIKTRKTFTAHWGEGKDEVVSVAQILSSNLKELLEKLEKLEIA